MTNNLLMIIILIMENNLKSRILWKIVTLILISLFTFPSLITTSAVEAAKLQTEFLLDTDYENMKFYNEFVFILKKGNDNHVVLYCYNLKINQRLWSKTIDIFDNSFISNYNYFIMNDKVFIEGVNAEGFYQTTCLNIFNGNEIWMKTIGSNSCITIIESDLIVIIEYLSTFQARLSCIIGSSGEIIWDNVYIPAISTISYDSKRLFTYCFDEKRFFCIDLKNGRVLWKSDKSPLPYTIRIVPFNDEVFISFISCCPDEDFLRCIDSVSGKVIWEKKGFSFELYFADKDSLFGYIRSVTDHNYKIGALGCLSSKTGDYIWSDSFNDDKYKYTFQYDNNGRITLINFGDDTNILKIRNISSNNGDILNSNNYQLQKYSRFINYIDKRIVIGYHPKYVLYNRYASLYDPSNPPINLTHKMIDDPIILLFKFSSKEYKRNNTEYNMDAEPFNYLDKTYIPAKYLVEPLGGSVSWDDKGKKVTCKLIVPDLNTNEIIDNLVEMYISKPSATVNGKEVQIDPNNPKITPIILNGRTMVPVRFLAESLGCEVKWIAETKSILITYKP